MIEGKVWGETERIFRSDNTSVHVLKIKRGGFSSRHRHDFKTNYFYVIEGAVAIRTWREGSDGRDSLVDETLLRAGQSTTVNPLLIHQFEAIEDSRMIEIYITYLVDPDIDRLDSGGLRCEAELKAKKKSSE